MKTSKIYYSKALQRPFLKRSFGQAIEEILYVIKNTTNYDSFGTELYAINNSKKHINGVTPIKEQIFNTLHHVFQWRREVTLPYFKMAAGKGGPIDLFKKFEGYSAGVEFETGNIASVHRSINKLKTGWKKGDIDFACLILPVKKLSYFLTDRIANYEEIAPYFPIFDDFPLLVVGFDADLYTDTIAPISKEKSGRNV